MITILIGLIVAVLCLTAARIAYGREVSEIERDLDWNLLTRDRV